MILIKKSGKHCVEKQKAEVLHLGVSRRRLVKVGIDVHRELSEVRWWSHSNIVREY